MSKLETTRTPKKRSRNVASGAGRPHGASTDDELAAARAEVARLQEQLTQVRGLADTLLPQCRILAKYKAGRGRLWQDEFRQNINAFERAVGIPDTAWVKPKASAAQVPDQYDDSGDCVETHDTVGID